MTVLSSVIFNVPSMCRRLRCRTIWRNWPGLGWWFKVGGAERFSSGVDFDEMRSLIGFLTEECCTGVILEKTIRRALRSVDGEAQCLILPFI